jgi:hypothetical protein
MVKRWNGSGWWELRVTRASDAGERQPVRPSDAGERQLRLGRGSGGADGDFSPLGAPARSSGELVPVAGSFSPLVGVAAPSGEKYPPSALPYMRQLTFAGTH